MTHRVFLHAVRFDGHVRDTAAASLLLGAAFVMTACGGSGEDADNSPTSPSATASDTPASATSSAGADPQAAEKAAVLNAYHRFWDEQAKAYAKGDTAGTAFVQYAAAEAKSGTEADLKDLRSKGVVTTGAPTHKTTVDALTAAKQVPSAKLTDCMDSTGWKFIYRKTGKPVEMPENRLIRYVTKIDAEKWGKQWKIVNVTPQQRAC
ncbi:hypothetical protein ACWD0J_10300 [Streptomyces sp. NPDC003011]